ncbi:hypothetical protein EHS25_007629 [Saitozyma podzolica]|uniref:GOLD domain-containing protein n=1 Tax=Saitozyma podzolica TaxID=1890683 RepID=A0A427YQD3_9TREE|nr:hypothetical protein EHS25_007629 [Saitozyma podzolica]
MIVPGRSALAALILAAVHIRATALTAMLNANERSWFYFAVQSGGSFDVDYVVMDPDDKVGEYSFCFENEASMSDKLLDFEAPESTLNPAATSQGAHIFAGGEHVQDQRTAQQHHEDAEISRIFWFTVLESVIVIAMSLIQIWILKTFFSRGGRRFKV